MSRTEATLVTVRATGRIIDDLKINDPVLFLSPMLSEIAISLGMIADKMEEMSQYLAVIADAMEEYEDDENENIDS